jgi:hypothetical protein
MQWLESPLVINCRSQMAAVSKCAISIGISRRNEFRETYQASAGFGWGNSGSLASTQRLMIMYPLKCYRNPTAARYIHRAFHLDVWVTVKSVTSAIRRQTNERYVSEKTEK